MRSPRFRQWITSLVDAALPEQIRRVDWADTGIVDDPGVGHHTFGLVLTSPAGGTTYLMWVHGAPPGGDDHDKPEKIVEGEAPAPVPIPELAPDSHGRLPIRDLEQWLAAVLLSSGSREVERVEINPSRQDGRPGGLKIHWHSGGVAYGLFSYTLARGEQRRADTQYRILEAV